MPKFIPEEFLILVVDDLNKNVQLVIEILDYVGYSTTFATNGKQAIERVKIAKPDLILLDLMMPDMNGLEVCEHLKSQAESADIPIIFITASNDQSYLLEAFNLGAADYITKPFNPSELLARVRTHLELKQTRDELQNTLIELTKSQQEAWKLARLKTQFLANMSHEIRTPLNGVLGISELLSYTNLNQQQLDYLKTLKSCGDDLLNLINDILDLSKLEVGEVRLESQKFNLYDLTQDLKSIFSFQAENKGLEFILNINPDVPRELKGDPLRLRQILNNLISNAIKFTPTGQVTVQINVQEQKQPEKIILLFTVTDTGIGIDSEDHRKIFQYFTQVDASTTRRYGGTGLGLAISQQLVKLMGGEIGVKSALNQGASFWFTAEFKLFLFTEKLNLESDTKPPEKVEEHLAKTSKILVVEDIIINQKIILKQLQRLGYKADCVGNGQEALDILSNQQYDLIFMDCQMPVLDGYETTGKLRKLEGGNNHIIIGLTAYAMDGDKEKCLGAGMDDYLTKPMDMTDLSDMLKKWLN